jgi:hypothetical protein
MHLEFFAARAGSELKNHIWGAGISQIFVKNLPFFDASSI